MVPVSVWLTIDISWKIIDLGKFHHDLTVLPNPGIMVRIRGIIPKWAEQFRLVKYYNLPRWIPIMNLTVANEKTPSRARRTTPNRTTRRVPGTISTKCRTREQLVARTGSGLLRFGEDVGELWGNGWNMMEYDGIWWNNYDGIWWNGVLLRVFFLMGDGSLCWFNKLGVDSCRNW